LIDDALHRLDFVESMLARPVRDGLMWLTLLGGLAVSETGVYLAVSRIRRTSSCCSGLAPIHVARQEQKPMAS